MNKLKVLAERMKTVRAKLESSAVESNFDHQCPKVQRLSSQFDTLLNEYYRLQGYVKKG